MTTHLRSIADENPTLKGIIDRVDFIATTHGQRDISNDRLSALTKQISLKRLGLNELKPQVHHKSASVLLLPVLFFQGAPDAIDAEQREEHA